MTGENTDPVPPLGDGFASTGVDVSATNASPDRGDQAYGENGDAYAYPSLNLVEFHVDTAPGAFADIGPLDLTDAESNALVRLLYTQIKALREELMHGTRSRLGITRNVRLLDRRVQELVADLASIGAGDTDGNPREIAESLRDLVALRATLQDAQEVTVETVDKFHIDSLLTQEDAVVEDLLERLAPHELFVQDVRTLLEDQLADEKEAIADETQYEALLDLRDRASWRLAEAAARAAADVPFLVDELRPAGAAVGLELTAFETLPVDAVEETLSHRLDIALEVAETATADFEADATASALEAPIRAAVDARTGRDSGHRRLSDVSLPLLDMPSRNESDEFHGTESGNARALTETETAVGYFLAGAFRTVGDFGGAVYRTPEGGWQWAINPWVRNLGVEIESLPVRTYGRFWSHNYFSHSVAQQIAAGDRSEVACPLCARSQAGDCGVDGCGFAESRSAIDRALSPR
jgi:hypothetical protein